MIDLLGRNSTRPMIRLFIGNHEFLSDITTSGLERTNTFIINEVNARIRQRNASSPLGDDHPDDRSPRTQRSANARRDPSVAHTPRPIWPVTRTRLVGMSEHEYDEISRFAKVKSLNFSDIHAMRVMWRLYNRTEIVARLDMVCPGHKFKDTGDKLTMQLKWLRAEKSS